MILLIVRQSIGLTTQFAFLYSAIEHILDTSAL